MTPCPQVERLAAAFGAERVDHDGRPAWRFWDFLAVLEGGGTYRLYPAAVRIMPLLSEAVRSTIAGLADEVNRRRVAVRVGDHEWRLVPSAEVVGGWVKNARVAIIKAVRYRGPTVAKGLAVSVSRRDDPAGWPLALGALYHKTLEPLIDHVLESPLYAADQPRVQAEWLDSVHSVGTFTP